MNWAARYIGIPFLRLGRSVAGVDCYGLHWLIEWEQNGRDLPRWDGRDFDPRDPAGIADLFDQGRTAYTVVERAEPFDIAVLKIHGLPAHMGVMVDRRIMIHACDGHGAVRSAEIGGHEWPAHKVAGFYRLKAAEDV
jgi:cell wall-associated NlpC family hydrolase